MIATNYPHMIATSYHHMIVTSYPHMIINNRSKPIGISDIGGIHTSMIYPDDIPEWDTLMQPYNHIP